jgi:predicted phage tail protein
MGLNSTSVIKIIDLLCEGQIQGVVGGKKGVYLDETPIQASDGTLNYDTDSANWDFRLGTGTQGRLDGYLQDGTSTATTVNAEIGSNYSETLNTSGEVASRDYGGGQLVRQITDTEATSCHLLFTIPALFSTAQEGIAKGQLFNATARIRVYLQSQGSAYNQVYTRDVTGIATTEYQIKTPKIELSGIGPWNIKVEKVVNGENDYEIKYTSFTEISATTPLSSYRGNRVFWTSIIEKQDLRSAYPHTACVGLSLSTKQFTSVPTRAYMVEGLKVMMPQNANVRDDGSLDFIDSFNGSLKGPLWTTCPVCVFYDMLTNDKHGAGDFIDASNLNWVDLYPLAQYANQLITNPDGTQEPRFAINTVISSQADAYRVLQDLASVFRGMTYWSSNTIQVTADHGQLDGSDTSPVHLYNNSNVIDGVFSYSGTSLKTRSTSLKIRFNDPGNFYKTSVITVEDYDLIAKYGYQTRQITAFGCTSKWQAQRMGRWMMAAEELDQEVVTFSVGLDGIACFPGQVFAIADEMRQGARLAGRVSSATSDAVSTTVVCDQTITLPSGSAHKIKCVMPDGTVEERTIYSGDGTTNIVVTPAFSSTPLAQSVWSISSSSVVEQKFRCLSIDEDKNGTYTISATQFNDSIYTTADTGVDLQLDDITTFDDIPNRPINLSVTGTQVRVNNNTINRVTAEWQRGTNGSSITYETRYKVGGGSYTTRATTNTIQEIDNLLSGSQLTFEVRAVGPAPVHKKSGWTSTTITVPFSGVVTPNPGQPTPIVPTPPDPTGVTIQQLGSDVLLKWDIPATGLNHADLRAKIRHNTTTDGSGTWPNSSSLTTVNAVTKYALLALQEGEYLIKFEDVNSGLKSDNAVSATIDLPDPIPRYTIQTDREDTDTPPFDGHYDCTFYSGTAGMTGVVLDGAGMFDGVSDVDALASFDFIGDRKKSGDYYFAETLDLGAAYSVLFKTHLKSIGVYPSDLFDSRTEDLDRWADFDGLNADDTNATIYLRTSDLAITDDEYLLETGDKFLLEDADNILLETNIAYGDWIPMQSGRYKGRLFQFKVNLTSTHIDQTPVVEELGYTMQLESRTEGSSTIASGAGAKAVTFTNAFHQTPNVGITSANLASGDYYALSSISRTGFTVHFKNASNASIDRNFEYQAVGYGKAE